MTLPKDSLKCIQDAWYKLLVDFRAWYMPETIQTDEWKKRDIRIAIKSCPSRMMDDSEAMLGREIGTRIWRTAGLMVVPG